MKPAKWLAVIITYLLLSPIAASAVAPGDAPPLAIPPANATGALQQPTGVAALQPEMSSGNIWLVMGIVLIIIAAAGILYLHYSGTFIPKSQRLQK